MRIASGVTDQYVYFVAVDSTDFTTRETGFSSYTVYRSRNGGAAAAMTTPTINETDTTNMPGVYELLLDEDMTIDAGDDTQEMAFHITHAGMAPVTRTIELYRPKITAGDTLATTSGAVDDVTLVATTTDVTNDVGITGTAVDNIWDETMAGHTTADTSGLVMNEWQDGGRLDLIVDDILADTADIQPNYATSAELAKVPKSDGTSSWNATALGAINAEVDTALNTTTYAEPGQELPAATTTLQNKISYLYKAWRNRSNQTATTYQLFADDATTVDQKATVSDDATTAEKGEIATGP